MGERLRQGHITRRSPYDSSFDCDTKGFACYWDEGYRLLKPAEPITNINLFIGKVGQQNILPPHLTLKHDDLVTTTVNTEDGEYMGIIKPGVSGFLFFGDCSSGQDKRNTIVERCVGKTAHTKTRIHVAQVKEIIEAGWTPFYAPLIDRHYTIYNPLHVIICPNSILYGANVKDATELEKQGLAKAFVRWEC